MSNRNWICFDCKITNRKSATFDGDAICSQCGGQLTYIGYKIPVPPKNKPKLWESLKQQLEHQKKSRTRYGFEYDVRNRHDLEHRIEKLKLLPFNVGRQSLIKQLEKELDTVIVRCQKNESF